VPWPAYPLPPHDPALHRVAEVLDPILTPMGFTAGQLGSADLQAQVLYCRGLIDSLDGYCVDLAVDLHKCTTWLITDVRYYGFEGDRMHLSLRAEPDLESQLSQLARTIAGELRQS
jgi:hypothetical protein